MLKANVTSKQHPTFHVSGLTPNTTYTIVVYAEKFGKQGSKIIRSVKTLPMTEAPNDDNGTQSPKVNDELLATPVGGGNEDIFSYRQHKSLTSTTTSNDNNGNPFDVLIILFTTACAILLLLFLVGGGTLYVLHRKRRLQEEANAHSDHGEFFFFIFSLSPSSAFFLPYRQPFHGNCELLRKRATPFPVFDRENFYSFNSNITETSRESSSLIMAVSMVQNLNELVFHQGPLPPVS